MAPKSKTAAAAAAAATAAPDLVPQTFKLKQGAAGEGPRKKLGPTMRGK